VVAAAALFDLTMGRLEVRPAPAAGHAAGQEANRGPVFKTLAGMAIIVRWWPGLAAYQSYSRLTNCPPGTQSTSDSTFQPKGASGTPILAFCNPWLQRSPPEGTGFHHNHKEIFTR
jgi:hypothetical protein